MVMPTRRDEAGVAVVVGEDHEAEAGDEEELPPLSILARRSG